MLPNIPSCAALLLLAAAPAFAQSRPPAQISVDNKRAATLTEVTITDGEGNAVGRLVKPLPSGKRGALKLGKAKGCEMNVQARFDDDGEVEETVNLCKDKILRFTE